MTQRATPPDRIRNVVLVGAPGAGRTTLAGALAEAAGGASWAAGGCVALDHRDVRINLLDPPAGDPYAGLRAADSALFVVSAADGVDPATAALWDECAEAGLPRAVAITRLDHPEADYEQTLQDCQEAFDDVLPVWQPMLGDDGASVAGLLGLITLRVLDYSAGFPPRAGEAEREHLTPIKDDRELLIEAVVAESEDEDLSERYVSGELISTDALLPDLHRAVARGHLHPVVPVCAATRVGLDALLDGLIEAAPSPLLTEPPVVTGVDGSPRPPLTADPDGPPVALVVSAVSDSEALVRVFSGTLPAGCAAGDLGVLPHPGDLRPGDVLGDDVRLGTPWPDPQV